MFWIDVYKEVFRHSLISRGFVALSSRSCTATAAPNPALSNMWCLESESTVLCMIWRTVFWMQGSRSSVLFHWSLSAVLGLGSIFSFFWFHSDSNVCLLCWSAYILSLLPSQVSGGSGIECHRVLEITEFVDNLFDLYSFGNTTTSRICRKSWKYSPTNKKKPAKRKFRIDLHK